MLTTFIRAGLALLLMLGLAAPALADDLTFSGDVTYRERIALPPDAELWITLVTLPDARVIVGAAANVASPAKVPLHFTLNVRSDVIVPGGSYGITAEIRSAGRTMFRNWQPVPVDLTTPDAIAVLVSFSPEPPHEAPLQVLPPAETGNPLLDSFWSVTSIGGEPTLSETRVSLAFAPDQSAGGNGGCNNYFSEASFDDTPLSFSPIAGTRMACAPDVMAQEAEFFAALEATAGYELAGDTLQLLDAAGVPLIGLVRAP